MSWVYVHGHGCLVCKLSVCVSAWMPCTRVQCMCEDMSVVSTSWVYVCGMIAMVHVERPENNPQELIFSFHHLPLPGELSCQCLPFKPFKLEVGFKRRDSCVWSIAFEMDLNSFLRGWNWDVAGRQSPPPLELTGNVCSCTLILKILLRWYKTSGDLEERWLILHRSHDCLCSISDTIAF